MAAPPPSTPTARPGSRGTEPAVPPARLVAAVAPEPPGWQPVSWRTRGLLVLLALGVAILLGWLMVQPKLQLMQARQARGEPPVPIGLPTEAHRADAARAARAEPPRCAQASVPGCVGGKMNVLVLPAPAGAARP